MNVILQAALPCARIPVGLFLPAGISFFLFSVPILLRSSWVGCQQPAKANHHKLLLFGSRGWRLYHSLVYKGRETTGLSQVRWILILPLPPRGAVIPSSEHFVLLTSITSHDKCFYQEEVRIFPDPPQRQIKSLSHRHSDWKKKKRKDCFHVYPSFSLPFRLEGVKTIINYLPGSQPVLPHVLAEVLCFHSISQLWSCDRRS